MNDFDDDTQSDFSEKSKPKVRRKLITPLGVLALLAFAVLVIIWLTSQITLTQLNSEYSTRRREYQEALKEASRLQLNYERVFDLTAIENNATARLGMRKATELQIIYIGAKSDNQVIILRDATRSEGILGKLTDILNALTEYSK